VADNGVEGYFMFIEYDTAPRPFFGHYEYTGGFLEKYEVLLGPGINYIVPRSRFVSQTEAYMIGTLLLVNSVSYAYNVGFIHSFPSNPNICISTSTWVTIGAPFLGQEPQKLVAAFSVATGPDISTADITSTISTAPYSSTAPQACTRSMILDPQSISD